MQPLELIRQSLGTEGWALARSSWAESSIIRMDETRSILPSFKIYSVQGATDQFDFPMLPHCSYGYFAANGSEAFQLTRKNREVERILKIDSSSLPTVSPYALAELVLPFYEDGIKESHRVLRNVAELEVMCADGHFDIDPEQRTRRPTTNCRLGLEMTDNTIRLRVLTLRGWMHMKANLGIETIAIESDGHVSFGKREVWSEKVFRRFPAIMY
jgi:hypothetical protein